MDRCTFETLLNVLRPAVTRENTKLPDCIAPEKVLALCFYRLAHENSRFQSWKIDCSRGSSRCCGGSCAATSTALLIVW